MSEALTAVGSSNRSCKAAINGEGISLPLSKGGLKIAKLLDGASLSYLHALKSHI